MNARYPGCQFGTCICAAAAIEGGHLTEAEFTSGVLERMIALHFFGYQRVAPGLMVRDPGTGPIGVVDYSTMMGIERTHEQIAALLGADIVGNEPEQQLNLLDLMSLPGDAIVIDADLGEHPRQPDAVHMAGLYETGAARERAHTCDLVA